MKFVVLPGRWHRPRNLPVDDPGARGSEREARTRHHVRGPRDRALPPAGTARPFRRGARRRAGGRRRSFSARCRIPIIRPRDQGGINASGELRIQLDLYANIRPCRSREGLRTGAGRRWTSSSCARTPKAFTPTATCTWARRVHADAGRRDLDAQDDGAGCGASRARHSSSRARGRGKSPLCTRSNVLGVTEGLFLREVRDVATDYPGRRVRRTARRLDGGAARARRRSVST